MLKNCSTLLLALTLAACGGGGGSPGTTTFSPAAGGNNTSGGAIGTTTPTTGTGTGTGNTPVTTSDAVTFSPAKLVGTYAFGSANKITVTATVNHPDDFSASFPVYAFIVDSLGVIDPNPVITHVSTLEYKVVLTTSQAMTPGVHSDSLSLRLCKDALCNAQYPGSPVSLPYEWTVK